MSKTPDGLIGRVIDQRYRIEALLGEGGMGLVYRATHTRLNKALAIKVLRSENTRDEEVLARFRREAESASAIGNQHIVDISDFGILEDGSTYFVMECLEGTDLIDAIDIAQRMSESRAVHIARQLCLALAAAHGAGIVHRDLKPENVFLIRRGQDENFVKVLDFGIAKVANRPHRLTRAGEVLGTPHYMSPEQCEGDNVDHRTDIYALGVLLYEMVTGHVPHDADTMMGILTKQMYEDPIPPRTRAPQLSGELEQVILRCLEKKPDKRYQTMKEVGSDLKRIQSGGQPVGPETVTLKLPRPPKPAHARVAPIYLGGLGLVALAVLGVLAVAALSDRAVKSEQIAPAASVIAAETPGAELGVGEGTTEEVEVAATESGYGESATGAAEPEAEAQAPEAEPSKRKPRRKPQPRKASQNTDGPILDPWK